MADDIVAKLSRETCLCWGCAEWGCDDPCDCDCHDWTGIHVAAKAEIERLRRWKAEAIEVLRRWDAVADMVPARLGDLKSDAVAVEIERLRAERALADKLARALRSVIHDKPTAHTDEVWLRIHKALEAHEEARRG